MDGANRRSTANEVLELFGLRFASDAVGKNVVSFKPGNEVMTTARACSVEGDGLSSLPRAESPFSPWPRWGKGW